MNVKLPQKLAERKIEEIDEYLDTQIGDKNAEKVRQNVGNLETLDGNFCQLGFWNLKKKICPQTVDPPMAKVDESGILVTAPNLLKDLYLRTYSNRLKHRLMKPEYSDLFCLKMELWTSRLENLKECKSSDWTMKNLEEELYNLKNNKTMDPHGMINEVFKKDCIGIDLKKALLLLFNGIKSNMLVPSFMTFSNITTIYKNKGSRMDPENDRGIYIITVLKKILDRLGYNDNYDDLDANMSDSNIGARKKRNIRNHLFIIYGVINSVIRGNQGCIDLQIYDLIKAFDALWLEDCLNDIFDTTSEKNRNDKLALLFESSKDNQVAVKTAVGMTSRVNMPKVVQQGGTWGPMLCSNSIDTVGKKCRDRGEHFYLYKGIARVLPLAMVDDLIGISKCGFDSLDLNTFITTQIELKKLKFHTPDRNGKTKCHKLHIGSKHEACMDLKVHGTIMKDVKTDTYLGDILSSDGKNTENIKSRVAKGLGIINQITTLLESANFGEHYFEIGVLLRDSMLINGILTNCDVWYNLLKVEIHELEDVDKLLLRKLLNVPSTTPGEAFYLELGILPISVIIKARRINYLHYLLSTDNSEMLSVFFSTQWNNPSKGDWSEQIKSDLSDFNISCDFNWIRSKSKDAFKNIVKVKAKEYAVKILTQKQASHSKMDSLHYSEIRRQNYFMQPGLRTEEKRCIFRWRTRMENFGENFREGRTDVPCPLCTNHLDNQALSVQCEVIKKELKSKGNIENVYRDDIKEETVELVTKISKLRKKLLNKE